MDIEKTKTNPSREALLQFWNAVRKVVSDVNDEDSKPTEDHENRIRRYYDQLLSNLNVPDIVTQMFQSGKLTIKEHEHLRQFRSTPIRASEELLNIIIMKSRDAYECFLESLKRTKQHHVYQTLTSDNKSISIGEQSVSEYSRLIRQNYEWLAESLDPHSGLLMTLYSKEVLSQRERDQIIAEKDRFVTNEILLSIISRKSVEDFKKFIIALNETSQGYIAEKLTVTAIGDANQTVAPAVNKKLPTGSSTSLGKRIPPKPPPKPTKQSPALPSSKPMVIKPKPLLIAKKQLPMSPPNRPVVLKPKPLLEPKKQLTIAPPNKPMTAKPKPLPKPKIHQSKPNRIETWPNVTQNGIVKKRSVDRLEVKLSELPHELQTDVSTKIILIHRRTLTDSIWKVNFLKILQESRNIKEKQKAIQCKATDDKFERLKQEIIQQERECKIIKEGTEREKIRTKIQLTELQERVHELKDRLNLRKNERKKLTEKLQATEFKVESLTALNRQKEQEVIEKISIVEKFEGQVKNYEMKIKEMEAQLRDTKEKLIEKDLTLKAAIATLEETQEELQETEAKLTEFEANLLVTEKDEPQGINKLEPVLVSTIRTKAVEEGNKGIRGLTILDKELFIVSKDSPEVEVYDSMKLSFSRRWSLRELIDPWDIGSCNKNKCLYIFNFRDPHQSNQILRVDPRGKLLKKWLTGDNSVFGLSVTDESNLIVTVIPKHKLNEYSPDGKLIREINLLSGSGILYPWHAIKLTNGNFMVSHGYPDFLLHRVCIVDADGKLEKSFGGKPGSTIGQINQPFYLSVDKNGFVMVADRKNSRVLLLNSDLKFKREILQKKKHGLRHPRRILLDEFNDRLFVADNERDSHGRILIFDLNYSVKI